MVKRMIHVLVVLILPLCVTGQRITPTDSIPEDVWNCKSITSGVILKSVQTRLFNSDQAIYIVDIYTAAGDFEFGVAAMDSTLITSSFAAEQGLLPCM